jgi:hypothetical protein
VPAVIIVTVARLAVASVLPVTQDEAYYYHWAHHLAWGYYDHPPGVALLGLGALLEPASALAARLGALCAATATLFVLWRLYLLCGLSSLQQTLALTLAATSMPGLVSGIITTPDSALGLCWALALHEGAVALRGDRRRWMSAGLATGLGLLGKYTMVIIGPVFLWALLRSDPRALRSPWPYLGAAAVLVVFAPQLWWNAENDWLTLRFQFGHGFSTDTGSVALAADALPSATGPFSYLPSEDTAPMTVSERLGSLAGFVGSQAGFWGVLLWPIAAALWAGRRRPGNTGFAARPRSSGAFEATRPLLLAGVVVPVTFFAALSLFSEVEPNWSAMYLTSAAPLLAVALPLQRRAILIAGALNLLLFGLYAYQAATARLPLPGLTDRILRESHGYPQLAAYAATLPGPVFSDRYAYAAMINFYAPSTAITQWPGITRPSEYSRGLLVQIPDADGLRQTGFWLIARKFSPPDIPGYAAVERRTIYDCRGQGLQVVTEPPEPSLVRCADPLHIWLVYHYQPVEANPSTR